MFSLASVWLATWNGSQQLWRQSVFISPSRYTGKTTKNPSELMDHFININFHLIQRPPKTLNTQGTSSPPGLQHKLVDNLLWIPKHLDWGLFVPQTRVMAWGISRLCQGVENKIFSATEQRHQGVNNSLNTPQPRCVQRTRVFTPLKQRSAAKPRAGWLPGKQVPVVQCRCHGQGEREPTPPSHREHLRAFTELRQRNAAFACLETVSY